MVAGITTVRMKVELKNRLFDLKVIDREPYESVIERLINHFSEDLELSEDTQKLVQARVKKVNKGEVMSTKELHEKIKKQRKKWD